SATAGDGTPTGRRSRLCSATRTACSGRRSGRDGRVRTRSRRLRPDPERALLHPVREAATHAEGVGAERLLALERRGPGHGLLPERGDEVDVALLGHRGRALVGGLEPGVAGERLGEPLEVVLAPEALEHETGDLERRARLAHEPHVALVDEG